ncbi:BAG family molecular chaperone regulator 4 [Electrophorus electricus]|uniref:BAG domain-containing protein n=1 Tax=Electrophorus electricus TaxID=8005 RepID=A0AAY5E979_ELEEL|nr:BAG family molecular chaperone regulator 4 [Electrophorus electricus]XP_035392083.1 BAG family molecular chaperone regulator 4 [Electrophorus electricus]
MAYGSAGDDRSGAAWLMQQQMQPDHKSPWASSYSAENNTWNNAMESTPYSGYPGYWYSHAHTAGPYGNAYAPATEVNGHAPYNPQAMSGYPNGVYSPGQYTASVLHPSSPFYCGDQLSPRQPQYQGCPDRSPATAAQPHYPGAPGYPTASYPHYGEGCAPNPPYPAQPTMHSRPQPEAWPHSGGYNPAPPQQQWPPGTPPPPHGPYTNHVRPAHPPPWRGPAPPPYEHKEPPYPGLSQLHPRNQASGSRPRPGTPGPNPGPAKPAEFSAPPHIYNRTSSSGGGEARPAPSEPPAPAIRQGPPTPTGPPPSDNPGLARVQQVLVRVQLLQEDVDEFVGKKTDKSYRCLEELLTKELLELDSVETNGQDAIRHARKEAVQKIQAILDHLEKKAF